MLTRVLVTGASGTLGSKLVRMLASHHGELQVTALMRAPQAELFGDLPNVTVRLLDILDTVELQRVVMTERPQAIVHCAASGVRTSDTSWFDMVNFNVGATLALFEASCRLAHCHFVHVSTGLVYRQQGRPLIESDPIDCNRPYGASKAAGDLLLRSGAERLQRRLTVLRPFSFTGARDGGDRLFPALLHCAKNGEPFDMSAGTQIRDFCAVEDVARAICLVLDRSRVTGTEVYNVGSGSAIPLRQIVEDVCEHLSLRVDIRFGAVALDPLEPMHLVADTSKLRGLGWRARQSLASAVRDLAIAQFPEVVTSASARAYG